MRGMFSVQTAEKETDDRAKCMDRNRVERNYPPDIV